MTPDDGLIPVVLFTNSWMMGGMEQHVLSLAGGLRRRGHRTAVVCSTDPVIAPLRDACRAEGITVHEVEDRSGISGKIARMRTLTSIFRQYRGGLLHLHLTGPYGGEVPMAAARIAGMRSIVRTEHQPLEAVPPFADRLWLRLKDRGLSAVICVSSQNVDHHTRELGRDVRRFSVVHNCVDLRRFDPERVDRAAVRGQLGIAAGTMIVGTVARLAEERKGIAEFLQMAAQLSQEFPDARFVIVGDGELRPALERQAKELGIAGKTLFAGERRDIPEMLAAMDVFVMPSHWEGGPYTLLEAMAMERPSVTTNVGMVGEVITPGEGALVVPPKDVPALVEAVRALLTDEPRRSELAAAGRRLVLRRFSEENLVEGVVGVYSRFTAAPPEPART